MSLNISQIEPQLFVGGQFTPEEWPQIYDLGVRAVLSLQAERSDRFSGPPPARTLQIAITDFTAPSLDQLAQAVAFIAAAHEAGLPTFVHCHAGMGRAPTIAAAFLIAERGMTPAKALELLVVARPIVDPSHRQIERLVQWADHCRR